MNQESLSGLVRIINYVCTYLIYIPQLVEDSLLRSCSDTRWCSRVASSNDVRVLRVLLLSLDKHVNVVSAKCFFQLRQLRRIRHSLDDTTLSLHLFMRSSQLTRQVDYCDSLLIRDSKKTTDKLQRVP